MKLRALLITAFTPMVLLTGCDNIFGLDNYDEPDSTLTGQLVYNGQPVNVRTGGIEMELWQPGFDLLTKIPVYVAQDGSFSASLFAGNYKLNAVRGQGPWLIKDDTLQVSVSGTTDVDFPVTPYFVVNSPTFSYVAPATGSPEGRINATFSVGIPTPRTTARDLEFAALYISTTSFADRTNRLAFVETTRANLPATWPTAPITLGVNLPAGVRVTPSPEARTHVTARIGLKVTGITEMIFSPAVRIAI